MNTDSPSATETADAQAVARSGHISALRWAVRGVLLLGVTASLAANMLHAQPSPYAQVIAAWPPVALFATIEVISRVPLRRQGLAAVRIAATIIIGLIAAWISYWHMAAVVVMCSWWRWQLGDLRVCVLDMSVRRSECVGQFGGWVCWTFSRFDAAVLDGPVSGRAHAASSGIASSTA